MTEHECTHCEELIVGKSYIWPEEIGFGSPEDYRRFCNEAHATAYAEQQSDAA